MNRIALIFLAATLSPLLAPGAENPNLAPRAEITASQENVSGAAAAVADGLVPAAGSRDDRRSVWMVNADDLPASLVFAWPEPVTISTVVYYGRTTWGFNVFKDYAVYLDDAGTPVVEGAFRNGHGPQAIALPAPAQASKLRLEFRSHHAGSSPGAAEVQIFAAPPTQDDLLGHFTDLSLDYRYAYYPSHNLVRMHLPEPPADATDWHLALRPAAGGTVLAERSGALPIAAGGAAMPVPDLPEGDYTLTLTLTGGAAPVIEERGITRRHYEWEGLDLGRDDVVIPPFEPLTVDVERGQVSSVLREHSHGAAGLWDQIVSQGRELLAGPVRLEVTHAGGTVSVASGSGSRFTAMRPTHVGGEAGWTAGPLTGTTRFDYDYDGLKTLTLELVPTEIEIERLELVIPLKADEAWLMHPVTTGLRQHFAGRIPPLNAEAGTAGRVWDSSGVRNRLNGTFVPYLYVGGPERGICFAADNDRDWITDRNAPMMTLDREDDAVVLRLNLIARPAQLDRVRTLTFALQATPAKPMPENPYNWRRWWGTRTLGDGEEVQINFWGANMYWGGRHFATSVYPAFKDYGFWEQLARARDTGRAEPGYLEAWMARFEDVAEEDRRNLRAHYGAGLSWANVPRNTPETRRHRYIIPYTNPRGAHIETREFIETYIDEWLQGDITDPRWARYSTFQRPRRVHTGHPGVACWYQVEPVPTRIDMLLFYHQKMLETFADGIYWDNFFLQPNFMPAEAGGPGYVDDDGRPRAGVHLMGFRELVKRTATMMHVMGMRPLTYIHMTNVNIVPMLSFGTLNLDWEWRDQGRFAVMDLQDRLGAGRDTALILAHNLGLQTGNISVGIDRFHPPRGSAITREWLFRTVMAVCMPHEIKVHQGDGAVSFVQGEMARFGYGQADCRVYRYWEDGFPLAMEGANMHALVLAREDGRAMLTIGNYGPAHEPGPDTGDTVSDGPTLEAYDAGQRGEGVAETAAPEMAPYETYRVRLTLDLEALGLPESVQAYDVELRAGREKAENRAAIKPPDLAVNMDQTLGAQVAFDLDLELDEQDPSRLKRLAPGVFELDIVHHDFVLIAVE